MEIEIGITCLLLVALTFLALIDTAFGELSDVGLRRMLADAEDAPPPPAATFLNQILDNRARFRFTLTAAIQFLLVGTTVLVTAVTYQWLAEWFTPTRFLLLAAVVALVLALVFRQLIPRLIAARRPEGTLMRLLPVLRPVYPLLSLLAFPRPGASDRVRRDEQPTEAGTDDDEEEDDEEGIEALINVGMDEGIIEEDDTELIRSTIEFGDTRVNEVMTPRTEIVALPLTATVREARDVMVESKYSRLPVYRAQIDTVEGLIYVRDLLQCWGEAREAESIEPLLRPAYFIPETKPVADLLAEMQKAHVQLAMVIDEYGGVAGLVTVEDILEELVGEIEDEDTEGDEVVEIVEGDDGYYDVLGSTEVGKVERLFDCEIEDDDFTTIAGLVINELGQVPRPGTRLHLRGLDVEVLEADERRIGRLRLRRAPAAAQAAEVE